MGRVKAEGRLAELGKIRAEGKREDNRFVLAACKEVVLAEYADDPDRDPFVIHPSEMCKPDWCVRATFYRISGKKRPPERFNFVRENIFDAGNDAHEKWQRRMRATGRLYGLWECASCKATFTGTSGELPQYYPECIDCLCSIDNVVCTHELYKRDHVWVYKEVRLRPVGSLIVGRADGGFVDEKALVEIKTVGEGTVRKESPSLLGRYQADCGHLDVAKLWKELNRPFPGHVKQANIYLWLAQEAELPFEEMHFIYEFKANQQVKEFVIRLSMDIVQPLLDKADLVIDALKYNRPPKCEFGGCEQCQAYEEPNEGSPKPSPEPDGSARRVVTRRAAGAGASGARGSSSAPARETTRVTRRTDRGERPRADEADVASEQVGRVSRVSVGRSGSRRTVRHKAS